MKNIVPAIFLGVDIGTSGCRAAAIDGDARVLAQATAPLPASRRDGAAVEQDTAPWWNALRAVIGDLARQIDLSHARALAVDATSGTVLLADAHGNALTPALMYNDNRAVAEAQLLAQAAPRDTAAHGTASGLAKLLWLQRQVDTQKVRHAMHQADWIVGQLCGRFDVTDANNAIKTGYDARLKRWPDWLHATGLRTEWLPQVVAPGTPIATISLRASLELQLPPTVRIVAGTSDSTAAIIATGVHAAGDAVTSLGSTLVVKVVSQHPIYAPEYGVYSQPLGDLWLAGGGSSSGGAVLRNYFNDDQMRAMTAQLNFDAPTGLDYYPLLSPGERFPHADPHLAPRLTPRPSDDVTFFQGLLEGIARIEQRGYRLLAELGAPFPTTVRSVGGGASNTAWTGFRGRLLGVPLLTPEHQDAAYGAALLARGGGL